MKRISVGNADLNIETSGSGEEWLVLLHEIGGTLESWSAVAPALSKRFHVLRYDQRGAGHSDRIKGEFSIETQIDDLRALLDALSVRGPCHLAGGAIGSALAVRFNARFPKAVRTLVLACPAMNVSADRIEYLNARAAKVESEGMGAVVESSLANSYPPNVIRDEKAYAAYRARFLANDPASYAAINRAFSKFDAMPDLAAIKCPTLVLAGAHDKLRPPDAVREVVERIPGARHAVIDSGHIMPVQAPQAMIAAMNAFYDEVALRG